MRSCYRQMRRQIQFLLVRERFEGVRRAVQLKRQNWTSVATRHQQLQTCIANHIALRCGVRRQRRRLRRGRRYHAHTQVGDGRAVTTTRVREEHFEPVTFGRSNVDVLIKRLERARHKRSTIG